MAPKIQPIELFLKLRGLNDLKSFTKGFADFKSTVKLTAPQVTRLLKELTKVHGNTKLSTKALQGQITALKELRNNVGKDTKAYERLSAAILRFSQANKRAADIAIQRRIYAQRKGNLGRIAALESGTGSFKGFSQRATEITARANMAASGRFFAASPDAQLRPISSLAQQIQQIGLAQVDANFQRLGQSVSQVRQDILGAAQAGGNNVNALNAQRAALETLRNGLDIGSQKFKQITRDIQGVERRLNSLNKFSGKNLLGAGQGLLGATFVGGGAGLVGGLAGMGVEAARPGGNLQQGAITGGLIGSQLISPISGFISQSTQYSASIERLRIALRKAAVDQESFNSAVDVANTVVEKFNIPQEIAIRGITRLSAAVRGAGGSQAQANVAFVNTLAAIKGTAGGAEDVKGAITAMVQIFSKGRVSAEELSGQLGERFPAAVTKFAEANNINAAELQKQLKLGTVGLDMLMKFVISLGDEFIPLAEKLGSSSEEAGARFTVAMNRVRISVGKELIPIGEAFQEVGIALLKVVAPALETFARLFARTLETVGKLVKSFKISLEDIQDIFVGISGAIGVLAITQLPTLILGLIGASKAVIKLMGSLKLLNLTLLKNPATAILMGVTAASITAYRANTRVERFLADAQAGTLKLSEVEAKRVDINNQIRKIQLRQNKLAEERKRIEDRGGVGEDFVLIDSDINDANKSLETYKNLLSDITDIIVQIKDGSIDALTDIDLQKLKDKIKGVFPPFGEDGKPLNKTKFREAGVLANFKLELENVGEVMENIVVNGFTRMEDALVKFVTTGKLSFRDFANSVISDLTRMFVRQAITKPLFNRFFDFDTKDALGNVYGKNGIVPFAKGGVVSKPTIFGFANGGVGLMAEAGYPEAIMPLKRGRDGKLGVEASGGGGNIVNVTVNADSTTVEGNMSESKQLGEAIAAAIQQQLIMEQRPGGLLHG